MNKIKLLLILEATGGGTRRYITQILSHLDLNRFEPVLFCAAKRDPAFLHDIDLIRKRGIKVLVFPIRREVSPISDFWLIIKMARAITREKPDIVHTHSSKAGIIGRAAARIAGVAKVAHTPHVFPFEMNVGKFRRHFYLFLEKAAAKWTTLLIAVSNAEKVTALKDGLFSAGNTAVNTNGIEPDLWRVPDTAERGKLREQAGIADDMFVVGMVGRFMPQKGHRILIEASELLLKRHKNIHFALVGDGELKDRIRELTALNKTEKNFHFFEQTDEIAPYYAMFDCLVLPSLWEGCPFSVMEAMAMRIPVIASSVGGVGEIIEDRVSGLLVPPADAGSLAGAVEKLCENRKLHESLGQKGQQRIMEKFLLSDSIKRLEDIYRRMLQE
ncbi:MAG: glycosyltransferase family 4 protein [Victivallales bacterium]|jgi:glycosyltransferase involved in cell wall biosynthesis